MNVVKRDQPAQNLSRRQFPTPPKIDNDRKMYYDKDITYDEKYNTRYYTYLPQYDPPDTYPTDLINYLLLELNLAIANEILDKSAFEKGDPLPTQYTATPPRFWRNQRSDYINNSALSEVDEYMGNKTNPLYHIYLFNKLQEYEILRERRVMAQQAKGEQSRGVAPSSSQSSFLDDRTRSVLNKRFNPPRGGGKTIKPKRTRKPKRLRTH